MKYKKIPDEYYVTILDRLTRFEPAYLRYKRVFDDIINKFSIDIKLKDLNLNEQITLAESIFNAPLDDDNNSDINDLIIKIEDNSFKSNQISYQYLSARLNITSAISKIEKFDNLPKNILWLKKINNKTGDKNIDNNLLFPVKKILLCEGETERILISALLNLFNINLDNFSILLIPAGGKNQVARKYYSMVEYTKIPFFILLDIDAKQIKDIIDAKIRKIDKIYLIQSGEFEDLIPYSVLSGAINYIYKNEQHCSIQDFSKEQKNVLNLENIYKKYGFGEFKKAQFAKQLKEYIVKYTNKADFINSEIITIANALTSNDNQNQGQ